jgi:hypothetical protein
LLVSIGSSGITVASIVYFIDLPITWLFSIPLNEKSHISPDNFNGYRFIASKVLASATAFSRFAKGSVIVPASSLPLITSTNIVCEWSCVMKNKNRTDDNKLIYSCYKVFDCKYKMIVMRVFANIGMQSDFSLVFLTDQCSVLIQFLSL